MALSDGTRLGPYEILAHAGAGGMGEVYKARDTRLDRTVAVKILPAHLMSREDLRQRFEREARAASSLNHPHICTVHDIGAQDGRDFIVMEWLEGETLEARLRKGPLPPAQFFRVALEVAEGLDQAHQRGLTHRDLKPANIMLTKSGAKLLDFGLAKSREAAFAAKVEQTSAPTMTQALTQEGTVVGTFQYMAPEQLEGAEADARTDIFAFGSVLYEMASGRKAFSGRSQASLISSIMTTEPPPLASVVTEPLPPAIDHVVRRCLAKDPADRWQSVHDLLLELKWASQADTSAPTPPLGVSKMRRNWGWVVAAALVLVAAGEGAALLLRRAPEPPAPVRFEVPLPPRVAFAAAGGGVDTLAVSPDGRQMVFTGVDTGVRRLYHRPLDGVTVRPLPGTDGATMPFWSPDSHFVAFSANGMLRKIDIAGGQPQSICELPQNLTFTTGAWGKDGTILFTGAGFRIHRVSSSGGQPQPVLNLDTTRQEGAQLWPQFLPDGRHYAYYSANRDSGKAAIYLAELGSAKTTPLVNGSRRIGFLDSGWIFFERSSSVMAQPFDFKKLAATGEPIAVVDLGTDPPSPYRVRFSVSSAGTLVYSGGTAPDVHVSMYSRDGRRLGTLGEPGNYPNLTLSPDGKYLALQRSGAGTGDIWLIDIASGIESRLTLGPYNAGDPAWSPDGRSIVFHATEQGKQTVVRKPIGGGAEEVLYRSTDQIFPQEVLKDGSVICLNLTGKSFFLLPATGERNLKTLIESPFDKDEPHVSPDGRWIAYNSTESGRWEVYVAAFPSFTEKRQISSGGGGQPLWRKDGKELFYVTFEGTIMAVDVKEGQNIETGPPRTLFQTHLRVAPAYDQYRVSGDGQRFYVAEPMVDVPQTISVELNAGSGLRR